MPKRKVIERYMTWAALKPQLKGIHLGANKPQLACVHIGDDHVTVDAAALRDWTKVVEGAKFWINAVDIPEGDYFVERSFTIKPFYPRDRHYPPRHLRVLAARTVDGQKLSARFYQKFDAAERVWQVYL